MKDYKKILPCPICGSKELKVFENDEVESASIYCCNCPYSMIDVTKELPELIDIHNNRNTICSICEGDIVIADIAKRMGHRLDIAFVKIRKLEDRLIELGELDNHPCFICGYNGHDYHDPKVHKCMSRKKSNDYMKNESLTCDDLWEIYE